MQLCYLYSDKIRFELFLCRSLDGYILQCYCRRMSLGLGTRLMEDIINIVIPFVNKNIKHKIQKDNF